MRIAFYAPLKPPSHPTPSGDRRVARLLIAALRRAGHAVEVASALRSRDGTGDAARQRRLRARGERTAARLIQSYARRPAGERPDVWLTYHLYYKAPDWLGPAVTEALGLPYAIAEASHAPKRAAGQWAAGHAATEAALGRADLVIGLNPADADCVRPLLKPGAAVLEIKPFLDAAPFARAGAAGTACRAELAARHGLAADQPWLLAVAMMRPGDKAASYGVLAAALARLGDRPWRLLVVGDGPARAPIEAALKAVASGRIAFAGAVAPSALPAYYGAADIVVWPAINEAFGMAMLEAQAAGRPVVAGTGGGVAAIVADGETGALVEPGDADAFATAVARLLDDPAARQRMGAAALEAIAREHGLDGAAAQIDAALRALPGIAGQ